MQGLDPDQYWRNEAGHQAISERRIKPDLSRGAKRSNQGKETSMTYSVDYEVALEVLG
jgi:hypothetical protein